ncbi:MAG: TonB-dependent receptor [Dinghuibacter sp.]|nr:TonB-dependent receptor [Dinghuibacter sp.]
MKKTFFAVAAIITGSHLHAQQDTLYTPLDEVVITASKFPQKQNQTGKTVTVINNALLQQNQGKTLASVLNNQAGLMVNGAENANGANLSVYTRGASSQYTAILINGMPVTDPSGVYSYFDLNTLPVEMVERVEILKGGQSTLYGTDASAGVINIILKKPAEKKLALTGMLAGGTYNTFKGNVGASGQAGAFSYRLQYAHHDTKGFSTARDVRGNGNFDRDGFNQQSAQASIGYAKKNYRLSLFSQYNKYKAGLDDGAFRDDKDYNFTLKNNVAGLQSQLQFNKGSWMLQYSFQQHNRVNLNEAGDVPPGSFAPYFKNEFTGRNHFAETYVRFQPSGNVQLVAGAEMRRADAEQFSDYGFGPSTVGRDTLNNNTFGAYVSGAVQPNKAVNIEGGVRYTKHSEYGSNINWNINPSIGIAHGIRVFANVSTAFRAPSLDELFAPFYGNRNLDAERSLGWDAGFSFSSANKKFYTRMAAFTRRVKDVIVYQVTDPVNFTGNYVNRNEQQEEGFEAEATINPCTQWQITANYTQVQGRVKDGTKTTDNLFRRPKHLMNARVQYTVNKKWLTAVSFKSVGKRTDAFFPEPVNLSAYYTADLYVQYQPAKNMTLFTDIRNITDQVYFDINGYNTRRLNIMAGIMLNF